MEVRSGPLELAVRKVMVACGGGRSGQEGGTRRGHYSNRLVLASAVAGSAASLGLELKHNCGLDVISREERPGVQTACPGDARGGKVTLGARPTLRWTVLGRHLGLPPGNLQSLPIVLALLV